MEIKNLKNIVEVNGLKYALNSDDMTASVAEHDPSSIAGAVDILESISHEGKEYAVTSIGEKAFENCKSLTSVTIPNSVLSIGDDAFAECTSLTSLVIPDSMESIGEFAFYGCTELKSVTLGKSVTSIHDCAFSGCEKLQSIDFPDSLKYIGIEAFEDCMALETVVIPDSVERVGYCVFDGCVNLNSATIGSSLKEINQSLFANCVNLMDIYVRGKDPYAYFREYIPDEDERYCVFRHIPILSTLHVPEGCLEEYRYSIPWSSFFLMVEGDEKIKIERIK